MPSIPQTASDRLFKYSDTIFLEVESEFGARPSRRVDAMLAGIVPIEQVLHILLLILAEYHRHAAPVPVFDTPILIPPLCASVNGIFGYREHS